MPSTRKRIGYLPSIDIHEMIFKIAKEEKLSQSKVVGVLVEEALVARGLIDIQNNNNNLIRKSKYGNETNLSNSYFKYNEFDELISDKGITYNTKNTNIESNDIASKTNKIDNEELFEQFKQFILFQKKIKEK